MANKVTHVASTTMDCWTCCTSTANVSMACGMQERAGVSSQSPATQTLPSPCQEQYSRDCFGAGMKSKAVQCDHGREHAAPWRTLTASSLLVQRSTPAISPPLNRSGADGIAAALMASFMFHDAAGAAAAFMFNDAAGAAASATSSSAAHSVRRAILSLNRTRQVLYLLARPLVEFAGYKPRVPFRLPEHGFICTSVVCREGAEASD